MASHSYRRACRPVETGHPLNCLVNLVNQLLDADRLMASRPSREGASAALSQMKSCIRLVRKVADNMEDELTAGYPNTYAES